MAASRSPPTWPSPPASTSSRRSPWAAAPEKACSPSGYASWGPGQLDREMNDNVWLSAPTEPGVLFDEQYDTKWRRALGILRVDPVLLSGAAGHA